MGIIDEEPENVLLSGRQLSRSAVFAAAGEANKTDTLHRSTSGRYFL